MEKLRGSGIREAKICGTAKNPGLSPYHMKERCANGQQALGKMFNTTKEHERHSGNANGNYHEMPPHTHQGGRSKTETKILQKTTNVGEEVKELGSLVGYKMVQPPQERV